MLKYRAFRNLPQALLLILVFIFVNGCEGLFPLFSITPVDEKLINVVAMKSPFSRLRDGQGLEHDYLRAFADEFGIALNFKEVESSAEVIAELKSGKSDIAVGRFNQDLAFFENILPGPAFEETSLVTLCPVGMNKDIGRKVLGLRKDVDPVTEKKISIKYPHWKLSLSEKLGSKALLKRAARAQKTCVLLESRESQFYGRTLLNFKVVETIPLKSSVTFLIAASKPKLQEYLFYWFQKSSRNQSIARIQDRYFGHLEHLNIHDRKKFLRALATQMDTLGPLFKKYGKAFSVPWELIAAVAFQESHWRNDAISFTGVKGIMMLTRETADLVGVIDRTDLEESLMGGTKFLRYLLDQQPKFLAERERLALALASYNVGPGHLRDAQKLAVQLGRSPYAWHDLKQVLPLLSDPEYHKDLQFGPARGHEPVSFVNRVLGYYDLITHTI